MDFAAFFLAQGRPITLPHKRWRMAMTVIYSCRTIRTLAEKTLNAVPRSPSYITLDIGDADHQSGSPVFDVDAKILSTVVTEKKVDDLHRLGGVGGLVGKLASHAEAGIAGGSDDLHRRQEAFGSNTYPKPKPKGFFWFVYEALNDLFLLILSARAVVSLGLGIKEHGIKDGRYDGASILLAIFLVAVVSSIINFRQMKRSDKLATEWNRIHANVVRDGQRQDVCMFDIVVGDIVFLKIGDQVPADGLFLEGHSLQVDESSMTSECHPIDVDGLKNPFLISGVKVVNGKARMLVTAVGMRTAWGEMMSTITHKTTDPTPLQERLQKLTSSIGKIGNAVAILVFAVLMIRYFTRSTTDENGQLKFEKREVTANSVISATLEIFEKAVLLVLKKILQPAVTIIAVAIPEGLPLAVTLILASSMKRMMKDHALVRRLSACETMGLVTTICTDKTGTLTLNRMIVNAFWVGEDRVERGRAASIDRRILRFIQQGVGLNTIGGVYRPSSVSEPEITGCPTEKALLYWAIDLGMDVQELKRSFEIVHVEAFNSEKKRSGVLVRENGGAATITHWKGAAEMILDRCSIYFERNGMTREMDAEKRRKFDLIIKDMAACSLRCIAFAYKESEAEGVHVDEDGEVRKLDDERLTLLGLVGLKDPCRPEVRSAIESCRNAGVAVKMITGDNVFTARAIAVECGIIGDDDFDGLVVEGKEFRNHSTEKRLEMVDRIRVMARSSPFDKLLMVESLKKKGHVVAVTGDGTNDAPALKEADVGLSMGIQGTEVVKEISDIVIMDDNFDTVVTVMRWGRCVYNNIQNFLQLQLTVSIAALVIHFMLAITAGKVRLTTMQLLWVNLIMDTMGALALATDRPTKELMKKLPVGRTKPLISNIMWRNLTAQALFQIAVILMFQFAGKSIFGVSEKINNTMIFNTFVLCQVFNQFNARKLEKKNVLEGIHKNQLFLGIIAVTLILQVMMVELLKRFADTERLDWGQWGICAGIAAISWPIAWIVECIPVSSTPVFEFPARCKVYWESTVTTKILQIIAPKDNSYPQSLGN